MKAGTSEWAESAVDSVEVVELEEGSTDAGAVRTGAARQDSSAAVANGGRPVKLDDASPVLLSVSLLLRVQRCVVFFRCSLSGNSGNTDGTAPFFSCFLPSMKS